MKLRFELEEAFLPLLRRCVSEMRGRQYGASEDVLSVAFGPIEVALDSPWCEDTTPVVAQKPKAEPPPVRLSQPAPVAQAPAADSAKKSGGDWMKSLPPEERQRRAAVARAGKAKKATEPELVAVQPKGPVRATSVRKPTVTPVAERRAGGRRPMSPSTGAVVALLADGMDPRSAAREIPGVTAQMAYAAANRYAEEIAHLESLPYGQARYDYLQQRFGWGGGDLFDLSVAARLNGRAS